MKIDEKEFGAQDTASGRGPMLRAIDDWSTTAFDIISHGATIERVVVELRDLIGVDHVIYQSARVGSGPSSVPFIQLTYPATWIIQYLKMNYVEVDVVAREGFLRTLAFQWSDMSTATPAEKAMLADAAQHGIGPHGLSVPVRNKQGHRGLFSVSFSGSIVQWTEFYHNNLRALVDVAHRLHNRVIAERFGDPGVQLSAREIDCLFWTAQGKDTKDIALILNISFHTARDYLKSAKYKLNANTAAQAVTKSIELGLISLNTPE